MEWISAIGFWELWCCRVRVVRSIARNAQRGADDRTQDLEWISHEQRRTITAVVLIRASGCLG